MDWAEVRRLPDLPGENGLEEGQLALSTLTLLRGDRRDVSRAAGNFHIAPTLHYRLAYRLFLEGDNGGKSPHGRYRYRRSPEYGGWLRTEMGEAGK